ncbi:peptidase inhibitor family I36 protein [Streptomyces sp. NPDC002785]|uniref:peptidase inhibitor family I36 protein n=1 Tax=Streptomyces sp. NPDC002785 TaxID=3154543 RepID=UPI00332907EA
MKRVASLVVAAVAAASLTPLVASSAEAASCPSSKFCFYYNSNQAGSYYALGASDPDLAGSTFTSSGAGQGQAVKNNAASAWNNRLCGAVVFYNSNYGGPHDSFLNGQRFNLVNTYNQNASVRFDSFC